jgi:hypothetical protein
VRKLHKAFLRYYDPENWPILREGLQRMGRGDLIGNGDRHLVPPPGGRLDQAEAAPFERKRALPAAAGRPPRAAAGAPKRMNERIPAGTPFMAPPSKVAPSILSTIKAKPKAGRK